MREGGLAALTAIAIYLDGADQQPLPAVAAAKRGQAVSGRQVVNFSLPPLIAFGTLLD